VLLLLIVIPKMSQQGQSKPILIVGDSNVERNLLRSGRLYSQQCDSVLARNLNELAVALTGLQPNTYQMVIFAMLSNIVISAGNSAQSPDLQARLDAIDSCLKSLFKDLR